MAGCTTSLKPLASRVSRRLPSAACSGRVPFRLMPKAMSMAGIAAPPIRWMGSMTSSGTCQPVPATTRPRAEPTIMGFLRTIKTKLSGVVRCELVLASRIIKNSGLKNASWKISSGAT
jgi:hypothetical protein